MRYLYGANYYLPPRDAIWRIGYPFVDTDILPNNNPTSFSATGLPPGIPIDSDSGRLDGTPTTSGVYEAIITAHGPLLDLSEGYRFTVLGIEEDSLVCFRSSLTASAPWWPTRFALVFTSRDTMGSA